MANARAFPILLLLFLLFLAQQQSEKQAHAALMTNEFCPLSEL
jgi:hypothetical protein